MNECVGNPRILSNILAYLDGRHLADVEVVSRGWSDVISGSSLWRVRCTVDIERHELLDYIGWHSVEKEQMRFKAPLSECSGEYWKRVYAEWWNGFSCIQQQKKENKINNKGRAGMETVSPQLQGSTGSKEEAGGNSVGGCITTEHKIDLNMGKPGVKVVTCACVKGEWVLIGTNDGEVFVYCRSRGTRVKTVQQHPNQQRIISVAMFNERHVNKYHCLLPPPLTADANNDDVDQAQTIPGEPKLVRNQSQNSGNLDKASNSQLLQDTSKVPSVEWANTFIGMTEQCVLINTHTLQHQIENDSGHIGRSVHVWRDYLLLYMNYAELHVYRVHTRSIWDGEHETRQLAVKSAYPAFKVHEGTMFLSHITINDGHILTCYTDESFHGHLKVLRVSDGSEVSHHLFTFSLNNFIHTDSYNYVLFSYRKVYYFWMNKKVPQSPHVLTKEAKFIAVTPFCSYKLASKAKFAVVAQLDKTLQIHFNVMDKARQCSETLVPFKADAVLETEGGISVFRYMLTDFSLDPQGPTLVLLDSQGILTQHRWPYNFSHAGHGLRDALNTADLQYDGILD
ncbi:uncharacterized protein LOC142345328 isoform X2 [Convolutriloba macropyga]